MKLGMLAVLVTGVAALAQSSDPSAQPAKRELDFLGAQAEPDVYTPPTAKQRLDYYVHTAFGPGAVAGAGIAAAIDQLDYEVPEWQQGAEGFGKRLGWHALSFTTLYTADYALSTLLREDNNYYRCACTGLFPRLGHALLSNVTARRASGRRTFSISRVAAAASSGLVMIAFTPARYSLRGDGLRYAAWQYASGFSLDVAREFWPDIRRGIFRRK